MIIDLKMMPSGYSNLIFLKLYLFNLLYTDLSVYGFDYIYFPCERQSYLKKKLKIFIFYLS